MKQALSYPTLREYFQAVYTEKCHLNPRYSLRSFARQLEINPSALSQLIRGKRPFSQKMILRLGQKLTLSPVEQEHFLSTGENNELESFMSLEQDMFHLISEWYHFAILELICTRNFRPNINWVAKRLGLSPTEVSISLERLQKLEMIEITAKGDWIDLTGGKSNLGSNEFTSIALKKYQQKILDLAKEALLGIPLELRDQTGTTMAIDSKKIPKAKELIRKFRRQMGRLLTGENEDEVYHLSVSFFPLTKKVKKNY